MSVPTDDPRPKEPFVWDDFPRSPTEFRSPTALLVWGVVCLVVAVAFPVVLLSVAPAPRPAVAYVIAIGFGVVVLLLGLLSIRVSRRRAQWQRDLAAWHMRHPGEK